MWFLMKGLIECGETLRLGVGPSDIGQLCLELEWALSGRNRLGFLGFKEVGQGRWTKI